MSEEGFSLLLSSDLFQFVQKNVDIFLVYFRLFRDSGGGLGWDTAFLSPLSDAYIKELSALTRRRWHFRFSMNSLRLLRLFDLECRFVN